jgi:diadenosine tetraphosphate (Ap4A) HIT family hydrolase
MVWAYRSFFMTCVGCQRLKTAASPEDPFFLANLRESVATLHQHQPYRGWCVLWLNDHAEQLHELPIDRQLRYWNDVADLARAIGVVTGCRRINYENLGNVVPHVHWHIIPRYTTPVDPDPAAPVWRRPYEQLECGVTDGVRDELVRLIRAALR